MKRTVQLFIHQGVITKEATANNYGEIKVINSVYPLDNERQIVHTHIKHSFLWDDVNNVPLHNKKDETVFFFLVPLEYLFSEEKLIGTEDTPFLAVNVNDTYPFIHKLNDGSVTKHPCTTALTISADSFETLPPSEAPMSLFLMNPFYLNRFIRFLFHKKRRFLYGMNDYGELTVIDISTKEIEENNVRPWCKIRLKPFIAPKKDFFRRTYSPKREKKEHAEYKILVQKFHKVDPDWDWVIENPFGPQPVLKPPFNGNPRDDHYNPNLIKDTPKYPGIQHSNRWLQGKYNN